MAQTTRAQRIPASYEIVDRGLISFTKARRVEGGITEQDRGSLTYRFVPRDGTIKRALQVVAEDIDDEMALGTFASGCKVTARADTLNSGITCVVVRAENVATQKGDVVDFKEKALAIMRILTHIKSIYENKGRVTYPEQESRRK